MYKYLTFEATEQVAVISVNNPRSLNALNTKTLEELHHCLVELENSRHISVVILTGAETKAFVAGADISEMIHATAEEGQAMAALADEVFCRLEQLPQVTIAAVNGYALGGGCELAMSCDIRIAAETAVFGQPECGLGIIPGFGGTQRLARLVGKGRAKELIFTCDRIDAQEAYRIGLANKIVPKDDLMAYCMGMAKKILGKSRYAVSLAKACIESGMDTDLKTGLRLEATAFGLSFATHDKVEGMTAFFDKRPANFAAPEDMRRKKSFQMAELFQ